MGLARRREENLRGCKQVWRVLHSQGKHYLRMFCFLYTGTVGTWNCWSIFDGTSPNCSKLWFRFNHTRSAPPESTGDRYQNCQGTWKFAQREEIDPWESYRIIWTPMHRGQMEPNHFQFLYTEECTCRNLRAYMTTLPGSFLCHTDNQLSDRKPCKACCAVQQTWHW